MDLQENIHFWDSKLESHLANHIVLQNSRHPDGGAHPDASSEYDSSMERFRSELDINIIILIKQFW